MDDKNISSWWNKLTNDEFEETFRMTREIFTDLQAEIDVIENNFNEEIDSNLLACVWLLGNTSPVNEAEVLFNIQDTASCIETYTKKIISLSSNYIKWPTEEEAQHIEQQFSNMYEFSGVVGVLGSLYIEVKPDDGKKTKSPFYNKFTKKHMIVLQLVCDNYLLIRNVCVGFPGGKTIEDILTSSPLYSMLSDPDGYLVKNEKHLLGGYKHPHLQTLLTPYNLEDPHIEEDKYNFNVLHETVMTTMEKTLRILETKFPRLTCVDSFTSKLASLIVSAICVLHNFIKIKCDKHNLSRE